MEIKKHVFKVYNDNHFCNKSLNDAPLSRILKWEVGSNVIINGDNLDPTCAEEEDLPEIEKYYEYLRRVYGKRMLDGNHEARGYGNELLYYFFEDWLAFSHWHQVFMSKAHHKSYVNQKHGASWFKRKIGIPLYKNWRKVWSVKLSKSQRKRAIEEIRKLKIQRPGLRFIITAHRHPHKVVRWHIEGVRVLCLPWGKNEVSFEKCHDVISHVAKNIYQPGGNG